MRKTILYHFFPSKAEEEEHKRAGSSNPHTTRWEVVETKADPPHLLHIFPWEIKKVLTANDVGHFGSLELSPEQVHNHIFKYWDETTVAKVIEDGEQVPIVVCDWDTRTDHKLILRKWSSDENYSIYACWIKEFVARRQLKVGMLIGMYWDIGSSALRFSVLNKVED
ncbi:B3 domain-containing protein [Camellia lanceoleosa]|uniref:B3 domain-containing protein n=1 Tax=Camellia lanceoleosa TaxID=1840588 RepID=A0ACC0IL28_9ERIC|nr:B3 domain-containing protein [Camellia lanceoleosa]